MSMDLESMSRAELEKLRRNIDKALSTLAERERKKAIEAAEQAVAQYGFSLAELTGAQVGSRRQRGKNPPKYRNPENPDQTWTGRGRKPDWFREAEAAGRPLDDLAV